MLKMFNEIQNFSNKETEYCRICDSEYEQSFKCDQEDLVSARQTQYQLRFLLSNCKSQVTNIVM